MKFARTALALPVTVGIDLTCWGLSLSFHLATRRHHGLRSFVTRPTQMANTRELLHALAA